MTMRHAHAQALSARTPSMAARHLGRCPGLIHEHEPLGVEIELAIEPGLAPLQDVGPVLLAGVRGLFLRVQPRRWKNRHSVP